MNSNQNTVVGLVLTQVKSFDVVDEELIKNYVNVFSMMNPLSEEEKHAVIKHLHARLAVRMDRGAWVKEKDHQTWYYTAKRDITPKFWRRYEAYLYSDKGFGPDVVHSLDAATDEMMDLLGNPTAGFDFQRRGLVIGDVQSGKTSTYTALLNKAADAGYKVVILLTGTIEKLRRQTQQRIDEGFVGLDSSALIKNKTNIIVGVGNYDTSIQCFVLTSTSNDFRKAAAAQFNGRLAGISDPVLFVLKKNKSVLEKLEQWLRLNNATNGKIRTPMLLIDDEADNASVNTKIEGDTPTAINVAIRKLLSLFTMSNYVGFTATPYANVFINPDTTEEMLGDDLFPRDFIYALEAPTNYIGAKSIFAEDGKHAYMLKGNDDCEVYLPEKHTKEYVPTELPESLKEAVASFFIINAIRDLRGHLKTHRSMLINISRFINVQNEIQQDIDGYVRDMQVAIRNYCKTGEAALRHEQIAFLKTVFDLHFVNIPAPGVGWADIQNALNDAVASIVVRTVNGGNAAKNLNYEDFEEDGLRLIAVGGFSLSRGLTLEGLCVSYFYRNSKMYDTLMQMGRWFGYRDGYDDLCQIWMGEEAVAWYSYITTAANELKREIRKMQDAKKTPKDFGLRVRSDISILLVTARNKMRSAKPYVMTVSLNGQVIETPYLHLDSKVEASNYEKTKDFVNRLLKSGFSFCDTKKMAVKHPQILNVPKELVIDFLSAYDSHTLNMEFRTTDLISLLQDYDDGTVDNWDIEIGGGQVGELLFFGAKSVHRQFEIKKESGALQMSGKAARIGSANFAKGGLSESDVEEIQEEERRYRYEINDPDPERGFPQETYFRSGKKRNPLLIILPVKLNPQKKIAGTLVTDAAKEEIERTYTYPLIGLSIGIPQIDGRESKTYQYKINMVKYKELFEVVDNDYEEIDDTIEEDVE